MKSFIYTLILIPIAIMGWFIRYAGNAPMPVVFLSCLTLLAICCAVIENGD